MRPHPILPIRPNSAMPGRYLKVFVPPPFIISIISGGYPCSRRRRAPDSPEYRSAILICALAMYVAIVSQDTRDRKSTRLNSSHGYISYAVFCLKKKRQHTSCARAARDARCTAVDHESKTDAECP